MSSLWRNACLTDTRLASINDTAASLRAKLYQLKKLRDQVRKAQLSARRSPGTNVEKLRPGSLRSTS
jgi:hypothetical protein